MGVALDEARRGRDAGEVPIGAVLLDASGVLVARAFNRPLAASDPTAHAEILALRTAAERAQNYRLVGTTLIVTLEPCLMCVGALLHARVTRLVYGATEPKWGAIESLLRVGAISHNHSLDVIAGVRAGEASGLLQDFFAARRKAKAGARANAEPNG